VKRVDPTSPSRQSQHEQRRQSSCQLLSSALSRYRSVMGCLQPAHSSAWTAAELVAPAAADADDSGDDVSDDDVTASGGGGAVVVMEGDATTALSVISVGDFANTATVSNTE